MKKYLIFNLLSLIFLLSAFPMAAERKFDIHPTKKIDANPINVAVTLVEKTDTAKIASTCEYYGYTRQLLQEGYNVFTHSNGSIIRYKLSDKDQTYPIVEVKSKASPKEREQILKNLNFQKNGNAYERKSIGYITRCSFSSHGFLILTSQSKPKE